MRTAPAGALTGVERKLVAVATKLLTCPALLLLDEPFAPFNQPQHALAAAHLLQSLKTAASQLHMNVVLTAQGLPDTLFSAVDNVVMLDEHALPVYAGPPIKASSCSVADATATHMLTIIEACGLCHAVAIRDDVHKDTWPNAHHNDHWSTEYEQATASAEQPAGGPVAHHQGSYASHWQTTLQHNPFLVQRLGGLCICYVQDHKLLPELVCFCRLQLGLSSWGTKEALHRLLPSATASSWGTWQHHSLRLASMKPAACMICGMRKGRAGSNALPQRPPLPPRPCLPPGKGGPPNNQPQLLAMLGKA